MDAKVIVPALREARQDALDAIQDLADNDCGCAHCAALLTQARAMLVDIDRQIARHT